MRSQFAGWSFQPGNPCWRTGGSEYQRQYSYHETIEVGKYQLKPTVFKRNWSGQTTKQKEQSLHGRPSPSAGGMIIPHRSLEVKSSNGSKVNITIYSTIQGTWSCRPELQRPYRGQIGTGGSRECTYLLVLESSGLIGCTRRNITFQDQHHSKEDQLVDKLPHQCKHTRWGSEKSAKAVNLLLTLSISTAR